MMKWLESIIFAVGLGIAISLVVGPETPPWRIAGAFAAGTLGHLISYFLTIVRWEARDEKPNHSPHQEDKSRHSRHH